MADKFSIDDIVAEYSKKAVDDNSKVNDSKDEIVDEKSSEITNSDDEKLSERENIFTAKEFDKKVTAVVANAIIKDDGDNNQISDDNDNIKASENAQAIENLMKLKLEKGTVRKASDATPVNRASVKDINMGLTDKIIPKTEELDNVKSNIPDDATYEEKSRLLSERRKTRIDGFKLNTENDSDEKKIDEKSYCQKEFESFENASKIRDDILQVKNNLVTRMVVLMFTGIFSLLITFANDFELPLVQVFDKIASPSAFLFTNTILGLISIAISYTVLFEGVKNIFKRRADCDSIAALGIFFAVISGIVTLFEPSIVRENFYHVYTSVAIFGLIFNTLGKLMIVKRTERNFNFVAGDYERYALVNVNDDDVANKFTKGSLNDLPELVAMKKTEFISDFMKNSYSADISDEFAKKTTPYIFLIALVVGFLSLIFEKGASGWTEKTFTVLASMSGTLSMCSSLALMLVVNVPIARAQKRFLQYSGAMLGYSSVEEFADTNSVLIDCEQLFPNGMVDLVNLKLFSSVGIEECILMAASLSCQAGSVLRPTFYKMLRGKTEMLYPVESYIYEDGLGLSGWIENKRVLFGSRELMEHHSIEGLPSIMKEQEYAKGNIVIYLSISGVVSTLFVVRANASISVTRWLQELEEEGIVPVIRTVDGFVNERFISELFGISIDSMKLLQFRFHKHYENVTQYEPKVSSSMVCSGHFPSLAMLIIGAKKLKFISNLGIAVQMGAAVLGGVLSLIMMILGAFSQITPSLAICYNLAFVVVTLLIQHLKKI